MKTTAEHPKCRHRLKRSTADAIEVTAANASALNAGISVAVDKLLVRALESGTHGIVVKWLANAWVRVEISSHVPPGSTQEVDLRSRETVRGEAPHLTHSDLAVLPKQYR